MAFWSQEGFTPSVEVLVRPRNQAKEAVAAFFIIWNVQQECSEELTHGNEVVIGGDAHDGTELRCCLGKKSRDFFRGHCHV